MLSLCPHTGVPKSDSFFPDFFSHEDLLAQRGMYYNMWEDQTRKTEDSNNGSGNEQSTDTDTEKEEKASSSSQ